MAWLQLLFFLLLHLFAVAAGHAPRARADSASETDPVYRELIQLAHGAYEVGDLTEAKKQFQAAHARYPSARSLRGLGTVELALGDFAIAAQHLTQALASADLPLAGSLRAETEAAVQKARSQVGYAQLLVSPETAEIKLNDRVLPHGAVLVLAPGVYRLAVAAEGYQAHAREVTVLPGRHQLVQALLERSPPAAPLAVPESAPAPLPSPTPAAPAPPARLQPAPLLLLGASGALLVVGGLLLGKGVREHNRTAPAEGSERYPAWQHDQDRYPSFEASGAALLGLGGVGATLGLWWHQKRAQEERLRVAYSGDRVLLSGRF